jgi:homocysteine S-methyltransferase
MPSLTDALAAGPVVLDGGLGTLLEAHGHDLSSSLWSARLLLESPLAIRRAHAEYFRAGARVAITSSYQVSYEGLRAEGLGAREVDALLASTVAIAADARADAGLSSDEAWVAASVGPFGAVRADGSEYTGDYGMSVAQLRAWHRPRLHALAAAGADALAIETIPSLAEVEALCAEVDGLGVPVWVSVTVADGSLRSGESLADAVGMASSAGVVFAVGVNCCDVAEVRPAIECAARITALPFVAYPNSGEIWHADTRTWSGSGDTIHEHADEWVGAGARLIGGCCRILPGDIALLARAIGRP